MSSILVSIKYAYPGMQLPVSH